MHHITNSTLAALLHHSDLFTRGIIMLFILMSCMCIGLFFYKLLNFLYQIHMLNRATKKIITTKSIQDLMGLVKIQQRSVAYYILKTCTAQLPYHPANTFFVCTPLDAELQLFEHKLNQTIDEVMYKESSWLSFFFACAALAPLMGLLGTVWGLIHAFMNMQQSSSISLIAPGIAEALITTLGGLIVAIPSLCMYHILLRLHHSIEYYLTSYACEFNRSIDTIFKKDRA